jgi:hypothetical protein
MKGDALVGNEGFAGISRMLRITIAADEASRLGLANLKQEADASVLLTADELQLWRRTGEAPAFCRRYLGLLWWYASIDGNLRAAIDACGHHEIPGFSTYLSQALRAKRADAGLPVGDLDLLEPLPSALDHLLGDGLGAAVVAGMSAAGIIAEIYR